MDEWMDGWNITPLAHYSHFHFQGSFFKVPQIKGTQIQADLILHVECGFCNFSRAVKLWFYSSMPPVTISLLPVPSLESILSPPHRKVRQNWSEVYKWKPHNLLLGNKITSLPGFLSHVAEIPWTVFYLTASIIVEELTDPSSPNTLISAGLDSQGSR